MIAIHAGRDVPGFVGSDKKGLGTIALSFEKYLQVGPAHKIYDLI